jgi:hypothetical protein
MVVDCWTKMKILNWYGFLKEARQWLEQQAIGDAKTIIALTWKS